MIIRAFIPASRRKTTIGMTLIEVMVALGLSSILLAVVGTLSIYSARSFSALGNYVDLDLHSRAAADVLGRELRQATAVIDLQTNSAVNYVTLTNAYALTRLKVSWDTNAGTLLFEKTGQPAQTCLTGCGDWRFTFYTRAPNVSATNLSFNLATNMAGCKLINMSWKCTRTILGSKVNSESVQTAQIVLRNKVR
jgi:prepilin-type N-terminal cleavage/methylation domain-containing protein